MSAYENVVRGRLRLKGKALQVKADGFSKKKEEKQTPFCFPIRRLTDEYIGLSKDLTEDIHETDKDGSQANAFEDHLTAAERKFLQQTDELELNRLAKMASKSHLDGIQESNQYLANLTEHYDIPKVGPG